MIDLLITFERLLCAGGIALAVSLAADVGAQEMDLDDILGGFEDEDVFESPDPDSSEASDTEPQDGWAQYVDFVGATSLGLSYNVDPHRSSLGPPPDVETGTYYGNLQRLRLRADLQVDVDLPSDWRLRSQFFAFYDFAYPIHGQEKYTQSVIDDYLLEAEILDLWVAGSVTPWLDLKLGRQVVDWGRSESLRVTDVWNPLNNREPGLVDIEDLRLPVTMARADFFVGSWNFSALIAPEIRFDYDPPEGSDFFPIFSPSELPQPPPGAPTREEIFASFTSMEAAAFSRENGDQVVDRWGSTPEYGFAATGIFSGWDLSFYLARLYQNQTTSVVNLPDLNGIAFLNRDDRVTMVGAGGNYVVDTWLFKAEIAFYDELDYDYLKPNPSFTDPAVDLPYVGGQGEFSRVDWMVGLEYSGFRDTSLVFEVAHRRVLDYEPLLQFLPNYVYQDTVETALRASREFLRSRLRMHALGVVILNNAGLQGAFMRLWFEYELGEALLVDAGYLQYFGREQIPFNSWERNNRLFAKIKFSFD